MVRQGGPKKGNPLAVMLKYWRYSVGGSLMGVIDPRFRKLKKPPGVSRIHAFDQTSFSQSTENRWYKDKDSKY